MEHHNTETNIEKIRSLLVPIETIVTHLKTLLDKNVDAEHKTYLIDTVIPNIIDQQRWNRLALMKIAKTVNGDLVQALGACYDPGLHVLTEDIEHHLNLYNARLASIFEILKREEDRNNLFTWIKSTIRLNELYEDGVYQGEEVETLKEQRDKCLPKFLKYFGKSEEVKA